MLSELYMESIDVYHVNVNQIFSYGLNKWHDIKGKC